MYSFSASNALLCLGPWAIFGWNDGLYMHQGCHMVAYLLGVSHRHRCQAKVRQPKGNHVFQMNEVHPSAESQKGFVKRPAAPSSRQVRILSQFSLVQPVRSSFLVDVDGYVAKGTAVTCCRLPQTVLAPALWATVQWPARRSSVVALPLCAPKQLRSSVLPCFPYPSGQRELRQDEGWCLRQEHCLHVGWWGRWMAKPLVRRKDPM